MKAFKQVRVDRKGPVSWIVLNRPERKNALDLETAGEFLKALRSVLTNQQAAAIVVTGAGDAFSSGGDIHLMDETLKKTKTCKPFFLKISKLVNDAVLAMRRSEKPVIAAVPGFAGGVAFGLLLGADLRVASEKASFSAATIRIGLAANGSATYHLPRIIGLTRAAEVFFTGETLTAERALHIGLVNRIVPAQELEAAAQDLGLRLASMPRRALGRVKKLLYSGLDAKLPAQLEAERQSIAWSSTLPDFKEGVSAFLEKRRPVFNR